MKTYKNDVKISQLNLACKQYLQMRKAGVTENLAIRQLELFCDIYSKLACNMKRAPHHSSQVGKWSLKAIQWRKKNPEATAKENLIIEHGTPQREYARMVLGLYQEKNLNAGDMQKLIKKYWKLAVITIEEDLRLNKIARSRKYSSPNKRWAAAGITLKKYVGRK